MSEMQAVQIVALVGWLILCATALASYRMDWKKGVKLALVWVAIFTGMALFIDLVR